MIPLLIDSMGVVVSSLVLSATVSSTPVDVKASIDPRVICSDVAVAIT